MQQFENCICCNSGMQGHITHNFRQEKDGVYPLKTKKNNFELFKPIFRSFKLNYSLVLLSLPKYNWFVEFEWIIAAGNLGLGNQPRGN